MLEVFNRNVKKHGLKDVEARLLDGGKLTGMFYFRHVQLMSIYLPSTFLSILDRSASVYTGVLCLWAYSPQGFQLHLLWAIFRFSFEFRPVYRCLHQSFVPSGF